MMIGKISQVLSAVTESELVHDHQQSINQSNSEVKGLGSETTYKLEIQWGHLSRKAR